LHFNVTFPAPLALALWPIFKFPVKPGAVIWHDGAGWVFGVSDTALRHVILAGPEIDSVRGWAPALSVTESIACTLPRAARCALPAFGRVTIAMTSRESTEKKTRVFIVRLRSSVDCTPFDNALQSRTAQKNDGRLPGSLRQDILIQSEKIRRIVLSLDLHQSLPPPLVRFGEIGRAHV
jgi:hypothetical protein